MDTPAPKVAPPDDMAPPRFVVGSTMRHVLVMTGTGAAGLIAIFLVDLVSLLYISWLKTPSLTAGVGIATVVMFLIVSMFVGWGFPIGLVAVVSAIIALRRPLENRAVAVWAIALGTLSILYSAGWLLYTAMRAHLFG